MNNKSDFSVLKENKTYIIKTKNQGTIRQFVFKNSTADNIIGIYQNKEIQISKDEIVKINKFSLGKTIPIIFVGILIGGLSIYMINRSSVFY